MSNHYKFAVRFEFFSSENAPICTFLEHFKAFFKKNNVSNNEIIFFDDFFPSEKYEQVLNLVNEVYEANETTIKCAQTVCIDLDTGFTDIKCYGSPGRWMYAEHNIVLSESIYKEHGYKL